MESAGTKVVSSGASNVVSSDSSNYATFGQRLGAFLLDLVIVWVILFAVGMVLNFLILVPLGLTTPTINALPSEQQTVVASGFLSLAFLVALVPDIILAVVYLYLIATRGQTPGKMIVKIKIVKVGQTQPLGWGTTLLREVVGRFVSGIIPFLIGYLWMLWDKDKQTIHDKIGGTVVVKA